MLRNASLAALLSLGLPLAPASGMAVYGRDNRKDIHELSPGLQELARGVVALFKAGRVVIDGDRATLAAPPLLEQGPLSPRMRFAEQAAGAHCSGALVAADIVLTAGHCVLRQISCADTRFVFDFALREPGADPALLPASKVYSCAALLAAKDADGHDWALVRLDRPVLDRKPLALGDSGGVEEGDALFMIGHPLGLPAKYAGAAKVRKVGPLSFSSDLDAFGGNSGGPVFRSDTREIVGVAAASDSWLEPDPARPGLLRIVVLPKDWGFGTTAMDARRFAGVLAAQLKKDLLGRSEVARFQRRLEAMTLDLP